MSDIAMISKKDTLLRSLLRETTNFSMSPNCGKNI